MVVFKGYKTGNCIIICLFVVGVIVYSRGVGEGYKKLKFMMKSVHVGRNVSIIRFLRVMRRETLAGMMGVPIETVIHIESSSIVAEFLLLKVAEVLEVSVEGIKCFSEEAVLDYIMGSCGDHNSGVVALDGGKSGVLDRLLSV